MRRSTSDASGSECSEEVLRLGELEAKNARQKKLVAERDLEIKVLTAA